MTPGKRDDMRWRARWWVQSFPGFAWHRVVHCRWGGHRGPFHDGTICLSCGVEWDFIALKWRWFRVPDVDPLVRSAREAGRLEAARVVGRLCHWVQNRGGCADRESHEAFHYGSPCPYEAMAAVLRGEPDPRDG